MCIRDSCYNFLYSVYSVEQARFLTFGNNWGNFFLAFLFNQMANAANYQKKFERIQDMKEKQNFPAVWQEYGDLLYLIWTFQPTEDASLLEIESFVERWFETTDWLSRPEVPDATKSIAKAGVSSFARYFHSVGESFGLGVAAAGKALYDAQQ